MNLKFEMAKFHAVVFCAFLIAECCLFIDSKKSGKSSRFLHKRTGRVDTDRPHESPNERRSFLSSSRANSEQIDVGSIEDEIVKAPKSSTDVDDEGTTKGEGTSSEGHQNEFTTFDSVVKIFEASVKRLKRKLLRSKDFTLYSSNQKAQGNESGVTSQDNKTVSPSVASESSTKPVLQLSVVVETAISPTQTATSSSTDELAVSPTQASRVIQETAGVLKSVGPQATITPSSTAAVFTSDGNILPTAALAFSPILEAVSSSTDEKVQPYTLASMLHSSTAIAEEKPTSGINVPTTTEQTEKTTVLLTELPEGTTQPTTKEILPSEPAEPTTEDRRTEVQGKNKGHPPKEKKTGLFRSLSIEILIALVAGALCALLLVAFLVYRLKKRNEGSYELSESINMKVRTHDDLGMKKEVFV